MGIMSIIIQAKERKDSVMKKITLIAGAIGAVLCAANAQACTTLLVGNQATTNGAYYMARNEDYMAVWAKHFVFHPAERNMKGLFHSNTDGFTYPEPKVGLSYTSMQDWNTDDKTMGEIGLNSAGVGLTSTETIDDGVNALKVDPYVVKNGINEDSIENVILPRIHSAKEGVELLGKLIETRGSSQGFGVGFIDKTGIWYLETGSGHQWMARHIPSDKYFVSGNQGRLENYIPNNPNYLASPTLVSFAEQHGLYKPEAGKPFNFHDAYGVTGGAVNDTYNYPRVWIVQHILNPGLKTEINKNQQDYPVFLTPKHKISLQDVEAIMRNHYQGTPMDPYVNADPVGHYRPISVFRCVESHIVQVRPNLPAAIGEIEYISYGMSALNAYIPFYQGATKIPYGFDIGTDKSSDASIFWKAKKVQTLAMLNWKEFHSIVRKAYDAYEAHAAVEQRQLEKQYLAIYKQNPKKARELINNFEQTTTDNYENVTNKLTNELFTKLTYQVDMKSHFAGE